ncbi:MAG: hypothetical protein IH870_06045 [Chloroflexi bacterium]|nr:hypothetical protein [Chloroflexota bacterium]
MIETSSRTYQALTSIAADQAKKLLDLAEAEWSSCQRYAAVTIPEDMRDVYPTVIYIRSSVVTPEFELRRGGLHQMRNSAGIFSEGRLEDLTAILARY